MGGQQNRGLLQHVVEDLSRVLKEFQGARQVGLVEFEITIPFVGVLATEAAAPSLNDFQSISVLTDDVARAESSSIWNIRLVVRKDGDVGLILEKYDVSDIA